MTTTTETLKAEIETARCALNAAHDAHRTAAATYREAILTRGVSSSSPEGVACYAARATVTEKEERLADAKRAFYATVDGIR